VRIRRLEAFTARLPLSPGFAHFTGRVTALEEVFVRLTADDGQVGWGEVRGNMSYFSGESPASIVAALRDHLTPLVVGRPLRERGAAIAQFDRALAGNAAAKAVLDIALHDLAARAAGVPLYRWLGGRPTHAPAPAPRVLTARLLPESGARNRVADPPARADAGPLAHRS